MRNLPLVKLETFSGKDELTGRYKKMLALLYFKLLDQQFFSDNAHTV